MGTEHRERAVVVVGDLRGGIGRGAIAPVYGRGVIGGGGVDVGGDEGGDGTGKRAAVCGLYGYRRDLRLDVRREGRERAGIAGRGGQGGEELGVGGGVGVLE